MIGSRMQVRKTIVLAFAIFLGALEVLAITCPLGKVTTNFIIDDVTERFSPDTSYIEPFDVACNTAIEVEMAGGRGGRNAGTEQLIAGPPGLGAIITDDNFPVTPFTTIYVKVGGRATDASGGCDLSRNICPRGYATNGGGGRPFFVGTGGGGSSDIRVGGTGLSNRVMAAGGGGGGGFLASCPPASGGGAGGLVGGDATRCGVSGGGGGGFGGNQTHGGRGFRSTDVSVAAGQAGRGSSSSSQYGGGGGGGYYGGSGGIVNGGGGGSSLVTSPTSVVVTGVNDGDGYVSITSCVCPTVPTKAPTLAPISNNNFPTAPFTFPPASAPSATPTQAPIQCTVETYGVDSPFPVGQLSTFNIPTCASWIEIGVYGGAGASGASGGGLLGRGGYVFDPFYPVVGGSTLQIYVGSQGNLHVGGVNGAGVGNGQGGSARPEVGSGGGGAATLVRDGSGNDLIVAGGGGGGGFSVCGSPGDGGDDVLGLGETAQKAVTCPPNGIAGVGGGQPTRTSGSKDGATQIFPNVFGGGGGGGKIGGGAGFLTGGGGGSSFITGGSGMHSFSAADYTGNGKVIITTKCGCDPTIAPTVAPTATPSVSPTTAPTAIQTSVPSVTPTISPSLTPTFVPSLIPSAKPTLAPNVCKGTGLTNGPICNHPFVELLYTTSVANENAAIIFYPNLCGYAVTIDPIQKTLCASSVEITFFCNKG